MSCYLNVLNSVEQDTILYWDERQHYSISDLNSKITELIHFLDQYQDKSKWALCIESRFLFTAAFFALLLSGKTPIILGHCKSLLIDEQKGEFDGILSETYLHTNVFQWIVPSVISREKELQRNRYTRFYENEVILFTSGSTSKPTKIKKSILKLEDETNLLISKWERYLINTAVISTVSPLHQYGLTFNILLPFALKIPVFNSMLRYQEEFINFPHQKNYLLISSPAFLKRLDHHLKVDLSLNMIFSAGGILPFEAAETSQRVFSMIPTEIYGGSETGIVAYRQQKIENAPFIPFENIIVTQFADKTIKIDSPLIEERFVAKLNDRIEIVAYGFYLLGRLDKIVKIEEKRISLSEVESRLCAQAMVRKAVVIPLEDGNRVILVAVLELETELTGNERDFFKMLRRQLMPFLETVAIPKRWRIVESIPVNSQGKQSYYEIKALFE